MQKRLKFEHRYKVSADRLFALVIDLDALEAVSKPLLQIHHLPSGPVRQGQGIDVAYSLFGLFPQRPYRMFIRRCDATALRLRSEEHGVGIQRLVHEIEVSPDGNSSVLREWIEVDAGWRTQIVAACIWVLFHWRHRVRLRLLGLV